MKYVVNIIAELDQKHHSHIGAVYSRVCNMLLMVHKEHINSQDTETFLQISHSADSALEEQSLGSLNMFLLYSF